MLLQSSYRLRRLDTFQFCDGCGGDDDDDDHRRGRGRLSL